MRKLLTLGIGAAALLVLAAGVQPAQAACAGTLGLIQTSASNSTTSWIFSDPQWAANCGGGSQYYCYTSAPAMAAPAGKFWAIGTGNPAIGLGDDNGSFDASGWLRELNPPFGGYLFYPFLIAGGWPGASDGGCPVGSNPCTCVLLEDQINGVGYYAIVGARDNGAGLYSAIQPGNQPIQLLPIPAPGITATQRLNPSLDVDATVKLATAGGAVYDPTGCGCAPTGFRVREQIVTADPGDGDANAPVDRAEGSGWNLPDLAAGGPQGTATFGLGMSDGAVVRSLCGGMGQAGDKDVYLATELVFPDGFTTDLVSANSTRIECGPNLAEPEQNDNRIERRGRRPVQRERSGQGR